MPELSVPGTSLHYEVIGNGPVLLCIHGGNGSGDKWRGVGEALKGRFRVAFYDRKLFSPNTSTFSNAAKPSLTSKFTQAVASAKATLPVPKTTPIASKPTQTTPPC